MSLSVICETVTFPEWQNESRVLESKKKKEKHSVSAASEDRSAYGFSMDVFSVLVQ